MEASTYSIADLKKLLKGDNIVIGTERTLKELRRNSLEMVLLTSNCPAQLEQDVMHYSGLSNVEVVKLPIPNEELGILCKKPFSISVVSLRKAENK